MFRLGNSNILALNLYPGKKIFEFLISLEWGFESRRKSAYRNLYNSAQAIKINIWAPSWQNIFMPYAKKDADQLICLES